MNTKLTKLELEAVQFACSTIMADGGTAYEAFDKDKNKMIEALLVRRTVKAGVAQAPLADATGHVACLLHHFCDGDIFVLQEDESVLIGLVTIGFGLIVSASAMTCV